MHKRWCIIARPRTGSTLLENMIVEYWKKIDPTTVGLGEPLHPDVGIKSPFELDSEGFLIRSSTPIEKIRLIDLMDRVINIISSANLNQPVVLKVFTQEEYYSEEQYFNFFTKLKTFDFKFIFLDRDIFDQALSLYFMEDTGIVHRWEDEDGEFLTTVNGEIIRQTFEESLYNINEYKFSYLIDKCKEYKLLQEKICNKLNHVKVNYSTILEDCKINQIPYATPSIKKTYSESYKDKTTFKSWKHIFKYKK